VGLSDGRGGSGAAGSDMRIVVTGATGFVGRHLIPALRTRGHEVIGIVRSIPAATDCAWLRGVEYVETDMAGASALDWSKLDADALVHLAWAGLPDYRSDVHMDVNYPTSLALVRAAISGGIRQVQVVGTCLEYGLVEGCLGEDMITRPHLPYAVAKNKLREALLDPAHAGGTNIQWLRLFYMYGAGQNPRSLLAALDRAIESGADSFNMSGGEQIRDYLPVEQVAYNMARLVELSETGGIFNCCSGEGIAVKQLVENYLIERGSRIRLNLGFYDYPDYEPMAFWGSNARLLEALGDA